MNPLYAAAAAGAAAARRKCPSCGTQQRMKPDKEGRYHCKKCGHTFTRIASYGSGRKK